MRPRLLAGALVILGGCHSERIVSVEGNPSRTLSLTVGQDLALTLHTLGPGQYASPPTISGTSVRFLADSVVPPFTPGGPTQRFWFRGESPGQAVVSFHHTVRQTVVEDTVEVK